MSDSNKVLEQISEWILEGTTLKTAVQPIFVIDGEHTSEVRATVNAIRYGSGGYPAIGIVGDKGFAEFIDLVGEVGSVQPLILSLNNLEDSVTLSEKLNGFKIPNYSKPLTTDKYKNVFERYNADPYAFSNVLADITKTVREEERRKGTPLKITKLTVDGIKQAKQTRPFIIPDLLSKGDKMVISSPSKAGKTQFLIELAVCIATGSKLAKCDRLICRKGRVLYVNFELHEDTFGVRIRGVAGGYGLISDDDYETIANNIDIIHARGIGYDDRKMGELHKQIIDTVRILGKDYDVVIIDPLYKTVDGDENSNSDMARTLDYLDIITVELGCCVVFAHHFSKGNQANKSNMDKGAGAGTITGRDPDVSLVLEEIEHKQVNYETYWRLSPAALRAVAPIKPIEMVYEYPVHVVAAGLEESPLMGSKTAATEDRWKRIHDLEEYVKNYESTHDGGKYPTTGECKIFIGKGYDTLRSYVSDSNVLDSSERGIIKYTGSK